MSSSYSSSRRGQRSQSGRRPLRSTHAGSPQKSQRSTSHEQTQAGTKNFFKKVLAFFGICSFQKSITKKSSEHKTPRTGTGRIARTPRKPEQVEVTSPRLYIGNLSFDATESDLFELFSGIGQVQNVELVSNRDTHRSKGFGFVQMTVLEEAKRAVKELHDKEYMGRKLVVSDAKALPEGRMESRNESRSEELSQSS